jgi:hypothetical protein
MPDYNLGKIYKISVDGLTYYGSTATSLKQRMWSHKCSFNRWQNGLEHKKCMCFEIFDKYGFENCPIELVELYPCGSKKELLIREDWYIKNMDCCNENSAYTTADEARERNKQRYLKNIEQVREQKKKYRQLNKVVISEKRKEKYELNKTAIREKSKEKFVCQCGKIVCNGYISTHRKSLFHLANI